MRVRPAVALSGLGVSLLLGARCSAVAAQGSSPPALAEVAQSEVMHTLAEVREKYGTDAVMIEGFLMGHAIEGGAVLETSVAVSGIEERDQKKYLIFTLDTGIVYNDRELAAEARVGRTWTRIVERTLRRFRSVDIPADGLGFAVTYSHKSYIDEPDLRAHLSKRPGEVESVVFYVLSAPLADMLTAQISGQQLVDRAIVLVNGLPQRVQVEPPPPTETARTPGP